MEENLPINIELINSLINIGIMYAYKRDISYWPILIINVKKLLDSKAEESEFI